MPKIHCGVHPSIRSRGKIVRKVDRFYLFDHITTTLRYWPLAAVIPRCQAGKITDLPSVFDPANQNRDQSRKLFANW